MALVTVDQVDLALRLSLADGDERIPDIELKIRQAEDVVLDYLKKPDADWDEDSVPPRVNAAVLMVIQSLLDESNTGGLLPGLGSGDPTNPVVALLYRLRDPAVA